MPIRIGYLRNEVLWAFLEFLVPCMYMEQWENWDNYGKIVFCTTCSVVKEEAGAGVLRPGTYTEEKTEQGTQQRLTTWNVMAAG